MNHRKSNNRSFFWLTIVFIFILIILKNIVSTDGVIPSNILHKDTFKILASTSTKAMDDDLIAYGKKHGFTVEIEHYGDLEIVDMLNEDSKEYDAVWISNSIWLYMLDNSSLITDSKSIVINPVVMAIEKNKATELGFVDKEVYNQDILTEIRNKSLK